jgi:hypothetical protein
MIVLDDWQAVSLALLGLIIAFSVGVLVGQWQEVFGGAVVPDCDVRACERLVDGPGDMRYCEYFSAERAAPYYARCE